MGSGDSTRPFKNLCDKFTRYTFFRLFNNVLTGWLVFANGNEITYTNRKKIQWELAMTMCMDWLEIHRKNAAWNEWTYTWNHWSIAFKCHIYSVVSALSLFSPNQTACMNLQFSNTIRNVLVSTEISVNIPQLSPFNVKILAQSVVLISNSPKTYRKTSKSPVRNTFYFFSLFFHLEINTKIRALHELLKYLLQPTFDRNRAFATK